MTGTATPESTGTAGLAAPGCTSPTAARSGATVPAPPTASATPLAQTPPSRSADAQAPHGAAGGARHSATGPAALAVASPAANRPAQTLPAPVPQPSPTDLFADRLLAVLSGQRPVHWMLRHTIGRAYDELAWLAERGPLRTRGPRPVVRDIGYCVPRPGAIEAFARIGAGDQLRAMAFRLEQGPDLRWRCTAVELGGARPPRPADD
ncbi:Rv3235 family protein [Streptomyces sp. CA-249302]|uniref:Rv3235 family protein n=1 Tax=Streptomyces sp. CA-249302 TaxID=3240058 RepID=UPI003D8BD454